MTFDTKKATESWKKAKPLLLTDTGVSDFLRKMPADAMSKTYLGDLGKARERLGRFMAEPKIKAEKKALACLTQISADIGHYVDTVESNRKHVIGDMDGALKEFKKYAVEAIKNPTPTGLRTAWTTIAKLERGSRLGDPRAHEFDPPLAKLMHDWFDAGGSLSEAHDVIVKLLEAHAKKPLPDFGAQIKQGIKRFADGVGHMEKIRKDVANI
jgi:hypothetical protein